MQILTGSMLCIARHCFSMMHRVLLSARLLALPEASVLLLVPRVLHHYPGGALYKNAAVVQHKVAS